jgi:hypothetical protein
VCGEAGVAGGGPEEPGGEALGHAEGAAPGLLERHRDERRRDGLRRRGEG